MSVAAKNPIMPGFYPDPSICAVDGDYYLVCSSFSYFPGLPILHSRDLAHWEQIGSVLDRESQLPLENSGHSAGLFAPTIRYYDGTFYVICTNVSHGGNFIVTAQNPEGPWSEPYYIEGADGIDPSLFFDEDGTCYYIGTHPNPEGCRYNGDWYIWIQELDLKEMKLVGEHKNVWNGAMRNIIWPEGPHLYKKDGYYYIMHAEGGTGPDHAVTVCRSRSIWGPYENNFCNPILTHRHLGQAYPVKYVGHADMIQTPAGEWYMAMLAVRPQEGYTTMGRETFLAKVIWENDWPVVNPGVGMLTEKVEIDLPEWKPEEDAASYTGRRKAEGRGNALPGSSREYDFTDMKALGDEFLFLRRPGDDKYRLEKGKGLMLKFQETTLKELASPSYVAVRQQHHSFFVTAVLETEGLTDGRRAGIALVQSNEYQLRAEVTDNMLEVFLCEKGEDRCISRVQPLPTGNQELYLSLNVNGLTASIGISDGEKGGIAAADIDIRSLSTEVAGGFVGCTVGMYAVAEKDSAEKKEACFRSFAYHA